MKKTLLTFFVITFSVMLFAQKENEVRVSMGIEFVSVPKLKDYLEGLQRERLSDFSSAVNFSGSYGKMISENSQLEVELGYLLNSYNFDLLGGNYDLSYTLLMPSILYNYVYSGKGYNFKFGGGAGYRLINLTEKLPADPNNYNYNSSGFGLLIRGAGNTALAENVYAHISADIRYDVIGEPDKNSAANKITAVNFSSLSFGVNLGISYQF